MCGYPVCLPYKLYLLKIQEWENFKKYKRNKTSSKYFQIIGIAKIFY